jgi:hypothetical protein
MFVTKDPKEIKWYWYDKKLHAVSVSLNGESLDLEELYKSANKILKDKEDMCKNISYLGLGLTGSEEAGSGFLLGWLLRSIKGDQLWVINHTKEDASIDEIRENVGNALIEYGTKMKEGKINKETVVSTPNVGGTDGTDLFSK